MKEADIEDLKQELWLRMRDSGEIVWITKNKDKIPIKQMSNSHLLNAIKMLEHYEEMVDRYYDGLCEHEDAGDRI